MLRKSLRTPRVLHRLRSAIPLEQPDPEACVLQTEDVDLAGDTPTYGVQDMQAIVIKQYGGPEVLAIEDRPTPQVKVGQVLVKVMAFGINHAEIYFRQGAWGDVAEISGIECVGLVKVDSSGRFEPGQKVLAIVGGMGRNLSGSYAEYVAVPSSNVAAIHTNLAWEDLAAIPESYATAWSALVGNLALARGHTLLVRGATSALGQAAVNIAAQIGAHVMATTRNAQRAASLEALGAKEVLIEGRICRRGCASAIRTASARCWTWSATRRCSIRSPCCVAAAMSAWPAF
ncbi:MAG: hypothetical protein WC213_00390 [Arenimonas sp.]|jgi:NADPH:quinone reductase-like Zn-dependent oxidoreductase